MGDEQAAKLRELAERAKEHGSFAWHALRQHEFREAASPDVVTALLDERDAAMALLRECRGWLDDCHNPVDLKDRIDALLGDGGEG